MEELKEKILLEHLARRITLSNNMATFSRGKIQTPAKEEKSNYSELPNFYKNETKSSNESKQEVLSSKSSMYGMMSKIKTSVS
jgi:hypothetical protein